MDLLNMTKIKNLYGLILAGGFSRRMGQDKALMNYHGKPQIEYVQNLLEISCEKVFLSKRNNQPTYKNITPIDDGSEFLNIGPLGGILSAMKAYPNVSWLVMACDLPFVSSETLEVLIKSRDHQKIATAFKSTHDSLPEPLCAIWEGQAYSSILEFLEKGIHCPRKVLIKSDSYLIDQSNPRWLDNINDLKEFEEAIYYLKK
jgi:molybdopterin-guanine dinucleotide biosynthesis protein A